MRHLTVGIALAATLVLIGEPADAQSWRPPTDSQRCPSKWGAGDQRGSANHMKPETVLRATRLIRTGEVIELGHVLSSEMPISSTRRFDMHTKRTFMNPQSNRRGSNAEVVLSEIGQVGTQFDGFAHQTRQDRMPVARAHFPVQTSPNPDPPSSLPVHHIMLVINGIHLLENLKLDELASKRVYEFAFVMQPLTLKGATGSPVAPIAVR